MEPKNLGWKPGPTTHQLGNLASGTSYFLRSEELILSKERLWLYTPGSLEVISRLVEYLVKVSGDQRPAPREYRIEPQQKLWIPKAQVAIPFAGNILCT